MGMFQKSILTLFTTINTFFIDLTHLKPTSAAAVASRPPTTLKTLLSRLKIQKIANPSCSTQLSENQGTKISDLFPSTSSIAHDSTTFIPISNHIGEVVPFLSKDCRLSVKFGNTEQYNRCVEVRDFTEYRNTDETPYNKSYVGIALGNRMGDLEDEIMEKEGTPKKIKKISFDLQHGGKSITFCKVNLNDSSRVSRIIQPTNNAVMKNNVVKFMKNVISNNEKPEKKINVPSDLYILKNNFFLRNNFNFVVEDSDRICIQTSADKYFEDSDYEKRVDLSVKLPDGTCQIVNFTLASKKGGGKGSQVLISERLTPKFGNMDFNKMDSIEVFSYFSNEIYKDIPTHIRCMDIHKYSKGDILFKDLEFEPISVCRRKKKNEISLIISKAPANISPDELISSLKRQNKNLDFCFYIEKDSEMEIIKDPSIVNFSVVERNDQHYISLNLEVSAEKHKKAFEIFKTRECSVTVRMKNLHLENAEGDVQVSNTEMTCRLTYNWVKASYQLDYSPQDELVFKPGEIRIECPKSEIRSECPKSEIRSECPKSEIRSEPPETYFSEMFGLFTKFMDSVLPFFSRLAMLIS